MSKKIILVVVFTLICWQVFSQTNDECMFIKGKPTTFYQNEKYLDTAYYILDTFQTRLDAKNKPTLLPAVSTKEIINDLKSSLNNPNKIYWLYSKL